MEEFAAQQRGPNGNEPAPLPPGFDKRPLAGWNSWAGAADHLFQPNVSNMIATSDVLAKVAPDRFAPQVVMRDAIYNLNESENAQWTSHAHENGQRTGTYDIPFAGWADWEQHGVAIGCDTQPCDLGPRCVVHP
jgi:hypothetical protein